METRAHYVAVGIFVLGAIILAFVAVLWLAHAEFGEQAKRYYIYFRGSVAGLNKGSQVQYNGIPVGRVIDIRVDPDNLEQIQITVEINTGIVDIKSDARAYLDTNILNGIATIQVRGGTRQAQALQPQTGHKYPVIQSGRTELEEVKASLPDLLADLKSAARSVNILLDQANRAAVAETLRNLRTISGNIVEPSRKLGEIIDNANNSVLQLHALLRDVDQSYIGRGGLKDEAVQALGDYDRLAKSLLDNSRQIQVILAENRAGVRDFSQRTLPAVDGLVSDLQRFVWHLTRLTTELEHDPTRLLFGDRREGYSPR
jgi:phospholipid/cholesterol/gamma-HCH transport system substrate-binding protein